MLKDSRHPLTPAYRRIVVKIGSQVLSRPDGTLDVTRMSALVDQVAELHKKGMEVILVSSGAVASGRSEVQPQRKLDQVEQRQLFSAVGQAILINRYYALFRDHGIVCGQVLTTKENFADRRHYLNQKRCMEVMLDNGVVPVINENDTVSVTELMFTDNDELSGLIASMMNAELLIMLSNVDGIFQGDPACGAELIREVQPRQDISTYITQNKSSFGRGGMRSKYGIAAKVAEEGITVVIANGRREGIITDLVSAGPSVPCTRFIAEKRSSAVKKWIAHSEGFAKGELHINEGCLQALGSSQARSLLPVGIDHIEGEFEKGDIVRIVSPDGTVLGVGKIRCDSETARRSLGKKGQKALIHYDYLYLEP
ncbi:MAG: glutamate 5-kinase [Bacteroidales bacterium]|nr:glutamate 5-kinase [Bacteroidales bacterium]